MCNPKNSQEIVEIEDLQKYWDQKTEGMSSSPIIGELKQSAISLLNDVEALLKLDNEEAKIESLYRTLNAQLAQDILDKDEKGKEDGYIILKA